MIKINSLKHLGKRVLRQQVKTIKKKIIFKMKGKKRNHTKNT